MPDTQAAILRPSRADRAGLALARCLARPGPWSLLVAVLLAAPIPLAMAFAPRVMINYTHHDVFIPLDVAWRTLQGQWPHSDYYSPLGLSYAAMHGAAAWIWGMNGRVVTRAGLVALPFVLVPGLVVAWRRLNALSFVVLMVLLAVFVTSPVFLDGPERLIAHLADYNRVGGALCAVVALWALLPSRRASRALDGVETVTIALAFLILLYLKVTFFGLAGIAAVAGCRAVPGLWRRGVLVGLLVVAGMGALELAHPGLLLGYVNDIRRAGAANTQVFRSYYAAEALLVNLPLAVLSGALAVLVFWAAPEARRAVVAAAAVAVASLLVATQNFGSFSAPLVVVVMVLGQLLTPSVARPIPGVGAEGLTRSVLGVVGIAAVVLAVAPFLTTHAVGTVYAATLRPERGVTLGDGRSETLRTVVWLPNPLDFGWMPPDATPEEAFRWKAAPTVQVAGAIVDDGLDLLAREGLVGRRIADLSFSNPFPAALRAPSPRGVALWWDEGRTFTADHLTPDQVVGDAEVVMVPKLWWDMNIPGALFGVAENLLRRDFVPHESRYWTAWVRRP